MLVAEDVLVLDLDYASNWYILYVQILIQPWVPCITLSAIPCRILCYLWRFNCTTNPQESTEVQGFVLLHIGCLTLDLLMISLNAMQSALKAVLEYKWQCINTSDSKHDGLTNSVIVLAWGYSWMPLLKNWVLKWKTLKKMCLSTPISSIWLMIMHDMYGLIKLL